MAHPNFRRLSIVVILLALLAATYWAWQRYHALLPSAPSQKTTALNIDWQQVTIDEVRVYKAKRQVQVLQKGTVIKTYAMRLGFAPTGHRLCRAPSAAPEQRKEPTEAQQPPSAPSFGA